MIGVQRGISGYELISPFSGPAQWWAKLDCGHLTKLAVDPDRFSPPRFPTGRYIDCPTCTQERDSQ